MYQKFLTARSPLRVLEKSLHGGLGKGNLGLVLAGPGIGKTSFLVGLAIDELLQGGHVLHVALDQTVAHTRTRYDTLFEELAARAHLDDAPLVHADVDRRRSIRALTSDSFSAAKLREAVKIEQETSGAPALVIVESFDAARGAKDELLDMKALAQELGAEIWLSVACPGEEVKDLPDPLGKARDAFGVILALEPDGKSVALRALKDHENPDPGALRVALDPRTLLLTRS
jgi:AAA domain